MALNPLEVAAYAGKLAGIACEGLLELLLPRDEPARALDDDLDFDEAAAEKYLRNEGARTVTMHFGPVEPWHGNATTSVRAAQDPPNPAVCEAPPACASAADGPAVAADCQRSGTAGHPNENSIDPELSILCDGASALYDAMRILVENEVLPEELGEWGRAADHLMILAERRIAVLKRTK